MIHCVAGFMFSTDLKAVALIHKNRPDWQAGRINAIGGKIEKKEWPISGWEVERPAKAMCREFKEEAGIDTLSRDWTEYCVLSDRRNYKVHFFYAVTDAVYKVESITDELVAVYPTDRLPKAIIPNLRWLVPMALTLAHREDLTIGFDIKEIVR